MPNIFSGGGSDSGGGSWSSQALGLFQGLNKILPFNTIGVGNRAKVVAEEDRKTDMAKTKNKIILFSAIGLILVIMTLVLLPKINKK